MNEYLVRLEDGRMVAVYAWTEVDIPDALDQAGFGSDFAGAELVERHAIEASGVEVPYVSVAVNE